MSLRTVSLSLGLSSNSSPSQGTMESQLAGMSGAVGRSRKDVRGEGEDGGRVVGGSGQGAV
jgi:hypothetical protein